MKKIKLGDVCKLNVDTYSSKDSWKIVKYLETGGITENKIDEILRFDTNTTKLPSRAKRKVKLNNILYSTVRPSQRHYGFIDFETENLLVSTGFAVLDVEEKKADASYLYYVLTQDWITESLQTLAQQSTSSYPSIRPEDILDLDIEIPDINAQKKIGELLLSLDQKTKLNNRINDNLSYR